MNCRIKESLLFGAFADELAVYDPDQVYGDASNPYGPMFPGAIAVDIELEERGIVQRFVTYNDPDSHPCVDTLVVLAPDGVSAEQLYADSQWSAVADAEEISVTFVEAPDGAWNLEAPEEDIAYIEKIMSAYLGGKRFVDWNERALYLIGYAEGGAMATEYAMYYPARLSGYMSVGAPAVPAAYIDARSSDAGSFPFIHSGSTTYLENFPNAGIPVPAWIISTEAADDAVIGYWKKANNVVDEKLVNDVATVYQPNRVNLNDLNTDQPIADLWVSEKADALEYNADFNALAWNRFLSRARRFGGNPGTSLRAAFEPEDLGMTRYTMTVDDLERIFYVYTPSTYDGSQALPLVIAAHGYSSTARAFASDSEWWRMAEKRNFIVAFVQAYPHKGNNVPVWYTNNTTMDTFNGTDEQFQAEVDFYKQLLTFLGENYNIDATRRYAYGHSNGSMLSCALADVMPEQFAAVSMDSGWDVAWGGDPQAYNDSVKLAFFATTGAVERLGTTIEGNDTVAAQMNKWCHANGLDFETSPKTTYTDGRYEITSVYAGAAPLVRFGFVENGMHAATPDECSLVWDLCFSRFSRGEDGTLYYEGVAVE